MIVEVRGDHYDLALLPPDARRKALGLIKRINERKAQRLFFELFPDQDTIWTGPTILDGLIAHGQTIYARDKYPKHLEFFEAGATYRERCAMCANRIGKTFGMGGFEVSAHLTGRYPNWWPGRRFKQPVSVWAAGKSYQSTRETLQLTMCGSIVGRGPDKRLDGRGLIPGRYLGKATWVTNSPENVSTIRVRHASGGWSTLGFKAYEQGRGAFEGTGKHIIWSDEECPMDVYSEMLIRTATLNGMTILTFTPLKGLTELALSFMPREFQPGEDVEDFFEEKPPWA